MKSKRNQLTVAIARLMAIRDQRRVKKQFQQNATTEQKAWVLTGAYLGAIVIAFGLFQGFDGGFGKIVAKNDLNSLGDFLAGVFAPLAFFWLVVSVKTQSKELAAQREELAMTRKEFVDNRAVMEKQAEAAEAHKNFVEKQTEIMGRQASIAEQAHQANYRMLLFEKRLEIYKDLKLLAQRIVHSPTTKLFAEFQDLGDRASFVFPPEADQWFVDMSELIMRCMSTTERDRISNFLELNAQFGDASVYVKFSKFMSISD